MNKLNLTRLIFFVITLFYAISPLGAKDHKNIRSEKLLILNEDNRSVTLNNNGETFYIEFPLENLPRKFRFPPNRSYVIFEPHHGYEGTSHLVRVDLKQTKKINVSDWLIKEINHIAKIDPDFTWNQNEKYSYISFIATYGFAVEKHGPPSRYDDEFPIERLKTSYITIVCTQKNIYEIVTTFDTTTDNEKHAVLVNSIAID